MKKIEFIDNKDLSELKLKLSIWKTLDYFQWRDPIQIKEYLKEKGYILSSENAIDLKCFDIWVEQESDKYRSDINLIRFKISDFGLSHPTYSDIHNMLIGQAIGNGKELYSIKDCPVKTAGELRLEYNDQPMGEINYISSKSIPENAGPCTFILTVENNKKYGLTIGSEMVSPKPQQDQDRTLDNEGYIVFSLSLVE